VLATPHDDQNFAAWCAGQTGQTLVDAAMRELAATGYLGNRLRQVASYLIHDLGCDWRRRCLV
jgi:deoxyribodipyrimidine photo-lyase